MVATLAQSPADKLPTVFVGLGVIVLLVAAAGITIMVLRRRFKADQSSHTTAFTIADLRRLHRDGQLSDEEFERMKQRILADFSNPTDTNDNALDDFAGGFAQDAGHDDLDGDDGDDD